MFFHSGSNNVVIFKNVCLQYWPAFGARGLFYNFDIFGGINYSALLGPLADSVKLDS